ncbi:MAG: glutamate synthase large subunit [Lentisphaeraceae bacterium]|nr:glutamate synthase large subunit [Lentisphaeraceae bacterium]
MDFTAKELGMNQRQRGLYLPDTETANCGAGFICSLRGEKSHDIIHKALEILIKLTHRGAVSADAKTGDGAGLLMDIPFDFFKEDCADLNLPEPGEYACGMVFLPREEAERAKCVETLEAAIKEQGLSLLGWREVPVDRSVVGRIAAETEPHIMQVFIGKGEKALDEQNFNIKLYIARKFAEREIRESELSEKNYFYFPSLSTTTIIYKGLLRPEDMEDFYKDLSNPKVVTRLALVHQRFSTNTFPTWDLAQPFRYMCHNGEINTQRGNVNRMRAREELFKSEVFGEDIAKLLPVVIDGKSDSATMDMVVELLLMTGRKLPEVMMMMVPEAWEKHRSMPEYKKAFYEYMSAVMEPWDGPASIPFTDGHVIGALLDRNGLRPSRYTVTKDGWVIMSSETGVVKVEPENVERNGRLEPGKMFLVDMEAGTILGDEEVKKQVAEAHPYREWLDENQLHFRDLPYVKDGMIPTEETDSKTRQRAFGYTQEDVRKLILPMAQTGKEGIGSMGTDTPVAVLSDRPQLLYNYFHQLFAQVTNPPLDGIREELVTDLSLTMGADHNIFSHGPEHCTKLRIQNPILTNEDMVKLKGLDKEDLKAATLSMLYPISSGAAGMEKVLDQLVQDAISAIKDGATIIILSDRGVNKEMAPIPALLAAGALQHGLSRERQRSHCGIAIETAEAREVHHFALLFGYGVTAVNPYQVFEVLDEMILEGFIKDANHDKAVANYVKAVGLGINKVMTKIGISTLKSYRGAQIFEAVGLGKELVDKFFTKTASRIGGISLVEIEQEVAKRHANGFPEVDIPSSSELDVGGDYQWRRNGERHLFNPLTVAKLQQSVRQDNPQSYDEYSKLINDQSKKLMTIRGLFEFTGKEPIPLEEVEDWTEIVKRFKTGAMSYGSISREAHENLAIAMNRIGGRSNSGEGGEDPRRFEKDDNGDWRRSAIKQVASGRFGVTSHYLTNSNEIQIKMAQGAKPGEGGQLPGEKVYPWVAKCRNSTPYVGLISPPPHHDIYSIEDLAQLIYDLKNANREARVNVKLVSEVGVGTIAAGVAKAKADVILVSGFDGGTGASPLTSLKHCGLPWELGLAEAQQTLVMNGLRSRIALECDGQLKTGRDVAIACLLGAEEFGFATAPLVASGCIMMRVCHLNTCPVGVATQDPELRKKFKGKPEHVIRYFRFVAEELRKIMAELGFRTIDEMVGQSQKLETREAIEHFKAKGLDLSTILFKPEVPESVAIRNTEKQDHELENVFDMNLLKLAKSAIEKKEKVNIDLPIINTDRSVGAILSNEISKIHGAAGLPEDTVNLTVHGSAGQSFGAFSTFGLTMKVEGDTNDYLGKGLSGAKLIIKPPAKSTIVPEENIITGNVTLYGAVHGEAYINGIAGERFCVRNSGAVAVVEGVGDHGCEYMTGGKAIILGSTGRNFAAGMSGGVAYILDEEGDFIEKRCNPELVAFETVDTDEEKEELKGYIRNHLNYTGSTVAGKILENFDDALKKIIKVMPVDYKKALERLAREAAEGKQLTEV